MKFINEEAFTFDDVLLQPQYNEIKSRKDVALITKFTKNYTIDAPIVSSNMDTVTEHIMMCEMSRLGGVGILHRFMTIEEMLDQIDEFKHNVLKQNDVICVSVGVGESEMDRVEAALIQGANILCIDVAHGDSKQALKMVEFCSRFKDKMAIDIIAGNVATAAGTMRLIDAGADAIKVGIGPGSMCTTRLVTGCGVPQLTAIMECDDVAGNFGIPIIADGGIKTSGDIVKALAAGASSVMLGSLLAGCDETPGDKIIINGKDEVLLDGDMQTYSLSNIKIGKKYRGMASQDAMTGWKGDYHAAPEGESKLIECKGPVENIVKNLLGGIRSGMTYCNASTIIELQNNAVFRKVTGNTLIENKPHGK